MPVKIRLARRGRKKRPYYNVVVADARAPRDGKFIESIGSYNPMTVPATIEIDRDKAYEWVSKGAQPTDTVRALLKFKGVYYKKHLMRGVSKGALTEEKATELYNQWIEAKEEKIAARREETKTKKAEFWKMVSGEIKAPKKVASKEAGDAFREGNEEQVPDEGTSEGSTEVTEANAPAADTTTAEATPVAEVKEEVKATAEEAKAEDLKEVKKEEVAASADDLTKIEGIGPAIAKILAGAGIDSFSALAEKSAEDIKSILENAEGNFKMHDPTTWPKQSEMAAAGKWDELNKWQDELDGGKVVEGNSTED